MVDKSQLAIWFFFVSQERLSQLLEKMLSRFQNKTWLLLLLLKKMGDAFKYVEKKAFVYSFFMS